MIGSLEVMHELISTIPSVIQICSISSISSIRLGFNLGKPRMDYNIFKLTDNGFFHRHLEKLLHLNQSKFTLHFNFLSFTI